MQPSELLPVVSVVMLNHNGLAYLKRSLPVVLALQSVSFECVVVDNGSSDGSIEFLESLSGVRLVRSPRFKEKNFACNLAIDQAKGEYILLLDNDIVLQETDLLPKLIEFYARCPNVGEIGLGLVNEGEMVTSYYGTYFGRFFTKQLPAVSLKKAQSFHGQQIGFASGAAVFLKKASWEEVGGYDDHLAFGGDDSDLGIKLWLKGCKNYLYAESIQIHIGAAERADLEKYLFKFRSSVHATYLTIFKNYHAKNVALYWLTYTGFLFLKSLKQAVWRKSVRALIAPLLGWLDFLKDLPHALTMRNRMQNSRRVTEDVFLTINTPQ